MNKLNTIAIATLMISVSGCDFNVKEEGELPDVEASYEEGQMPKYKITKTQEGEMPSMDVDAEGGKMPDVEVETMDVDVGMEKQQVEVPDVDVEMEEKTVSVPDMDVSMPDDQENAE